MSFEDDEYWDEEYSDDSPYADNAAVARDRYTAPRDSPFRRRAGAEPAVRDRADADPPYRGRADADPASRGRPDADPAFHSRADADPAFRSHADADPAFRGRADAPPEPPRRSRSSLGPVRTSAWDGEIADPVIDLDHEARPADELAARRKRRSRANNRPAQQPPAPAPRGGDFDTARPDWLDDPDFVPTDTSQPLPDSEVVDFNRPEFGADFDNPEFPGSGLAAPRPRRGAPLPDDDFDYLDPAYDDAAYAAEVARFGGEVTPQAPYEDPGFDDPELDPDPERRQRIRYDFDDPATERYGYADGRGPREAAPGQHGPASTRRPGRAAVPPPDRRSPGARPGPLPDQRNRVAGADSRDHVAGRRPDQRDRVTGPRPDRRDRVAELRPDQWGEWVPDDRDRPGPGARPQAAGPLPTVRPGRARVTQDGVIDGEWTEVPTADHDGLDDDNGPIRRPGRNRRVSGDPLQPTSAADREAVQPTSPATGRARVPAEEDVLDLYKPRRDEQRREPRRGTDHGRPAADHRGAPALPQQPAADHRSSPPIADRPGAGDPRVPARPAADHWGAPGRPADHRDPPGTPRVVSKATPPVPPRVISKAAPPAQPKVVKAEPPAQPKVVSPAPPGTAPVATPPAAAAVPPAATAPAATPPAAGEPASPTVPLSRPPSAPVPQAGAPAVRPAAPPAQPGTPAASTAQAGMPAPPAVQHGTAVPDQPAPGMPAPLQPRSGISAAPQPVPGISAGQQPGPGISTTQQPGPGPSADHQPGFDMPPVPHRAQPGVRPEDLRPAPLPTVPASTPAHSGSAPHAQPIRSGDERPAWAGDTPLPGSGRVTSNVALPPTAQRPSGRHPVAPPEVHRRAEPTPINGAVPRPVDTPPPHPADTPHSATPRPADTPPHGAPRPADPPRPGTPPRAGTHPTHNAPSAPPAPNGTASPGLDTAPPEVGRPPQPPPGQDRPARHARPAPPAAPQTHGHHRQPAAPHEPGTFPASRPGAHPASPAGVSPADQNGAAPASVPAPRSPGADARPQVPAARDRLVPIGRLVTSGPDTPERRYADADLGNSWFSTKKPTTADAAPVPPQRTGDGKPTATEAKTPAPGRPVDTDGVVIDLDITGLFHGYGVTAEQALIVAREEEARAKPATEAVPTAAPEAETKAAEASGTKAPEEAGTDAAEKAGTKAAEEIEAAGKNDERVEGTPAEAAGAEEAAARPDATATPEAAAPAEIPHPLSAVNLDALRWRLDGGTLREVVDDREALRQLGARLDGPLAEEQNHVARAGLLSVRAEVYRLLGELGMAAAASRLALAHAEAAADVQATVIAQAELAHVLRLRGDFGEADRLFEQAASSEAPEVLRSVVHENAGRCCFDQGRLMEALDHFARAIRLGPPDDLDLVERIGVSLEAVYIHVLRDGWGPYPRLRSEILS